MLSRFTKRCRFTLIELLVVIAIIAVLAAILLPALSRARLRAEGITCLNQNRQLSLAIFMYADDFSRMPKRQPLGAMNVRNIPHYWNPQVFESLRDDYAVSDDVWACPGTRRAYGFYNNGNVYGYSANYMYMVNFRNPDPENAVNQGAWYDSPPSAATEKHMESDKLMLAEYIHWRTDLFIATHSSYGDTGAWTGTKVPSWAAAVLSLKGASRIFGDGSGFWFDKNQMGANNEPPAPIVGKCHYSHTTDGLRSYYW